MMSTIDICEVAEQAGFMLLSGFVERDPVDRLESVYCEAAKHGLVASIQPDGEWPHGLVCNEYRDLS